MDNAGLPTDLGLRVNIGMNPVTLNLGVVDIGGQKRKVTIDVDPKSLYSYVVKAAFQKTRQHRTMYGGVVIRVEDQSHGA